MPRTRPEIERSEKIDEIVAVAQRQLLTGGLDSLSIVAVAREVGVARNAVYWYFPTRDHLFVAVLRNILREVPAQKPPARQTLSERAVWIVNRIADVHPLLVAMHERARVAEVVAHFRDELEALLRDMVTRVIAPHVEPSDVGVAVDAFWAAVEGALLRQLPKRRRDAVVRFTLRQFIGAAAADSQHV